MPRGDRTGPLGEGPLTGRGAGYCAGHGASGYANGTGAGRGPGAGGRCGGGHGHRNRFYATGVPFSTYGAAPAAAAFTGDARQELSLLKSEADRLRATLEGIERRLEELQN